MSFNEFLRPIRNIASISGPNNIVSVDQGSATTVLETLFPDISAHVSSGVSLLTSLKGGSHVVLVLHVVPHKSHVRHAPRCKRHLMTAFGRQKMHVLIVHGSTTDTRIALGAKHISDRYSGDKFSRLLASYRFGISKDDKAALQTIFHFEDHKSRFLSADCNHTPPVLRRELRLLHNAVLNAAARFSGGVLFPSDSASRSIKRGLGIPDEAEASFPLSLREEHYLDIEVEDKISTFGRVSRLLGTIVPVRRK